MKTYPELNTALRAAFRKSKTVWLHDVSCREWQTLRRDCPCNPIALRKGKR